MNGEMAVMGKEGDTKLIWNSENADEVANARRSFNDLTGKGFLAFKVEGKDGKQGAQIREFDPEAERVILVPRLVGG